MPRCSIIEEREKETAAPFRSNSKEAKFSLLTEIERCCIIEKKRKREVDNLSQSALILIKIK